MKTTASYAVLEQLAAQQRHVLSGWRAVVLLRRATFATPAYERRWDQLPEDVHDLKYLLRQMRQRNDITPIQGHRYLYEVTVPYARQGFVDEREVLFELHPYAVISHLSALAFHGLTEEQPKRITTTVSADVSGGLLPTDTGPRDWEGVTRPSGLKAAAILGRPMVWTKVPPARFFGFAEYEPMGFPMRYTTPERTLVDGLQQPHLSGGLTNVLRAWGLARGIIDLDVLINDVERYDIAVLRQRVGFILDQINLSHPNLAKWRRSAHRGSSSRLAGSEPFASTFDERWNISINAPIHVLQESVL